MIIFYILLNDLNYKEDIALGLTSLNINNTVFIESVNINRMLQLKIPIFSGLMHENNLKDCGIFIGFTDSKEDLEKFKRLLSESGIENYNNNIYNIFYLEINEIQ